MDPHMTAEDELCLDSATHRRLRQRLSPLPAFPVRKKKLVNFRISRRRSSAGSVSLAPEGGRARASKRNSVTFEDPDGDGDGDDDDARFDRERRNLNEVPRGAHRTHAPSSPPVATGAARPHLNGGLRPAPPTLIAESARPALRQAPRRGRGGKPLTARRMASLESWDRLRSASMEPESSSSLHSVVSMLTCKAQVATRALHLDALRAPLAARAQTRQPGGAGGAGARHLRHLTGGPEQQAAAPGEADQAAGHAGAEPEGAGRASAPKGSSSRSGSSDIATGRAAAGGPLLKGDGERRLEGSAPRRAEQRPGPPGGFDPAEERGRGTFVISLVALSSRQRHQARQTKQQGTPAQNQQEQASLGTKGQQFLLWFSDIAKDARLQEGLLLRGMESGVQFPVVHVSEVVPDNQRVTGQSFLSQHDSPGAEWVLQRGVFEELVTWVPELLVTCPSDPSLWARCYILLGFKTLEGELDPRMEALWREWTGALYIYERAHDPGVKGCRSSGVARARTRPSSRTSSWSSWTPSPGTTACTSSTSSTA
ncbi:uncharacterized protein LOC119597136 [Penaeus monodon]|uniref:uncharacterized protein LOC119597136 n=1 Tax=Penaeus monodon TaxID=6687 RepID=UPI0018A6E609|nr:uncharacterized protein LOC119597136 [Penaeus monodon]